MNSVTTMPGNVIFLFEIADCYLYKFQNKARTQIAEGSCDIFESQVNDTNDETVHEQKLIYLRIKEHMQILTTSQLFVKIQYTGSYCYIFENSYHQIFCLSIQKHNPELQSLLSKFAQLFTVIDFSSELLEQRLRESIILNCSDNIEKEDIGYDMKRGLKRVSLNIGMLSGKFSKIVNSQTVTSSVGAISERASHLSDSYVNENTWNSIKNKSTAINDKLTQAVKPVLNIYERVTKSIGESFYNSENKYIKAFRQYSLTACQALNEGERKGRQNQLNTLQQQVSNAYLNQVK